jgi:ATP-binding cassette subfamily F protein 3
MLSVKNLRVEFGARVLFADLTFSIGDRDRITFAGHNGAGKSTLMKCLAGALECNGGEINKPKGCRVGYLPQEGIHISGRSLFKETESAFAEARALQDEIDQLSEDLQNLDPRSAPYSAALDRIGELDLRLEHFDPARIKPRIESVLQGLGFKQSDFTRDCGEFSGGWQMRIAMAKLFLEEPEVLLLDEPTNHLDINAQRWMENYLYSYRGAIALISHDRALMDGLTTRTIAFHRGRAEMFTGNYSSYQKQFAEQQEVLLKQYKAQQREIDKTKQFINRFRAQANKASQVQSRIKQLAKVEVIEIEQQDAVMDFRFPPPPLTTHLVAKLENAGKTYGDLKVLSDFSFEANKGEKIAIVGPNGAGKSTFCRLITGEEEPSAGHHELGAKTLPSFFNQNHADELDPDLTVLETVEQVAKRGSVMSARDVLGCFLFRGDDVFKKVGILSGGERSRVALVRMLVRPANFLILDEPTNHLDMQSQEVLQRALQKYEGTILIVSHNRDFLDPLVSKTLEFRPGEDPRMFQGNISYYLEKSEADNAATSARTSEKKSTASTNAKPAQTGNRKEQRRKEAEIRKQRTQFLKPREEELVRLESRITELEEAKDSLTIHLAKPEVTSDNEELRKSTNAYQSVADQLEKTFSTWSTLSAEVEAKRKELGDA